MRIAILLAAMAVSCSVHAACSAQSAKTRPHLIELYTSEGCSSCPPAERWLQGAQHNDDVAALEFHVDYWDNQGWRDPFDNAYYTVLQSELAKRTGKGIIYTPEVALDGKVWTNWYNHRLPGDAVASEAKMALRVDSGSKLRVRIDTQFPEADAAKGFHNYFALTEDDLTSNVSAGENRGKRLQHDAVVRAFAGPLPLSGSDVSMTVPHDVDLSKSSVVAFAQRPSDGAVAQVLALPLASCL